MGVNRWGKKECGTCGFPALRPEGPAVWCWTCRGTPSPFEPDGRSIDFDEDEAERLYARGIAADLVGMRVGVSGQTVIKRLRERGVPIRPSASQKGWRDAGVR